MRDSPHILVPGYGLEPPEIGIITKFSCTSLWIYDKICQRAGENIFLKILRDINCILSPYSWNNLKNSIIKNIIPLSHTKDKKREWRHIF